MHIEKERSRKPKSNGGETVAQSSKIGYETELWRMDENPARLNGRGRVQIRCPRSNLSEIYLRRL